MSKVCIEKISILQILNLHSSDITCCDFDENFRLASGSSDKKVVVYEWKPESGFVETSYSPITEYKYGVTKIKFIRQEGELITSSADGSISIFNVDNGELLHALVHVNLASVRTFCYVRENKYLLSAADDGSLCVFDLKRKCLKKSLQLHDETISVTCSSYDSKIVLTGDSTGFAKLWHISTFCDSEVTSELIPELAIPDCHDLGITNAHFSPIADITDRGKEYKLVTCGNDNLLKVWKIFCRKRNEILYNCSLELLFSIVGHGSIVTDVKFNFLGNMIASTSLDKTARLWTIDNYNYQCVKVLKGHKRYVTTCCFSTDGSLLATGSNDKTVIVWDLTGERTLHSYLQRENINTQPNSSFKKKKTSKIIQKIENLGNAVNSCAVSKDGILAAGGTDKLVRLWHRKNVKFVEISISPLEGHQYAVNQIDFSSCGRFLASCSVDGTTVVWNLSEYNQIGAVHSVDGSVKCCKFSPDSQLLATAGDDETVCVWTVNDLLLKATMDGHSDAISCLSFTSDSKYLASGCSGGSVRLWCINPCTTICLFCEENVHDLGTTSSEFCFVNYFSKKDNLYLLATGGNDSLVKLWEINIGEELTAKARMLFQLIGHGGNITCVRFSPNSSSIVASTASDKTARIWNTVFGNCLHVLDSKESILTCCAFSLDGSFIATGTLDKTIVIWDLKENLPEFETLATNDFIKLQNGNEMVEGEANEVFEFLHLRARKDSNNSLDIPQDFICPITHQLMVEPVLCVDGYNYEKSAIDSWFSSGKLTSPMTNERIPVIKLQPNIKLRNKIKQYVQQFNTPS